MYQHEMNSTPWFTILVLSSTNFWVILPIHRFGKQTGLLNSNPSSPTYGYWDAGTLQKVTEGHEVVAYAKELTVPPGPL